MLKNFEIRFKMEELIFLLRLKQWHWQWRRLGLYAAAWVIKN